MSQSVRDSLADAETLRMYARTHRIDRYGGSFAWDVDRPSPVGCMGACCLVPHALVAAHAAFRACPGLRG